MFKAERHAKILQEVRERGFIENSELAATYRVSSITIRRDLRTLCSQKLIKLEQGGAARVDYLVSATEPLYETKAYMNADRKAAIGAAAAELVTDGDTIILDSGTTTLRVAQALKGVSFRHLRIFTSDIMIAKELCPIAAFDVIVLGGLMRTSYYNVYGTIAETALKMLKADKMFLGIDAATAKRGISNLQLEEIGVKLKMMEISDEVIAVADSSKFGIEAPYQLCSWSAVSAVVTDDEIDKKFLDLFDSLSIRAYKVSRQEERTDRRKENV